MARWQFTKGLHDLGNGCHAWLQPDGGWGYSNSGLIADQGETLLVDTLFDLAAYARNARRLSLRRSRGEPHRHAGQHPFQRRPHLRQSARGRRPHLASRACAEEMAEARPERRAEMMRRWREFGDAGAATHELYSGKFDFEGIVYTPPTETFERELTLHVGAKEVRLAQGRPGAYARRRHGPRAGGPHGVHRRYRVRRRPSAVVGRADLELDQGLRHHPVLGRGDGRARARADHRQARRPRAQALFRIRDRGGAQALRRRHGSRTKRRATSHSTPSAAGSTRSA